MEQISPMSPLGTFGKRASLSLPTSRAANTCISGQHMSARTISAPSQVPVSFPPNCVKATHAVWRASEQHSLAANRRK
eukprot:8086157-Alexandrium_andersonii.AAC.1